VHPREAAVYGLLGHNDESNPQMLRRVSLDF
jgi:hypothetical protein